MTASVILGCDDPAERERVVLDLLRSVTTSVSSYRWKAQDRVHLQPLALHLHPAGDRERTFLERLRTTSRSARLDPSSVSNGGGAKPLRDFLRDFALVRSRAPHAATRRDVVVAVWGAEPLPRVLAELPLGPGGATLQFLTEFGGAPTSLIRIPHEGPPRDWADWLARVGVVLGDGVVRVFQRPALPMRVDVFVELGWEHPLEAVLTHCSGPTSLVFDDHGRSRWLELTPEHETNWVDLRQGCRIVTGALSLLASRADPTSPVDVALELRALPAGRGKLEAVISRSRRLKEELHELERTRAELLSRRDDPLRHALVFRQDDPSTLSDGFRRFLRLAPLERFDHALVRGGGASWHVVVSNRLEHREDVLTELADDVYRQPATWERHGLDLFVREDCELFPSMDSPALSDMLRRRLIDQARRECHDLERPMFLLCPGDGGRGVEARVVDRSHFALLQSRVAELTGAFPGLEVRTAEASRAEFRRARDGLELEVATAVRAMEDELIVHGRLRLEELRTRWTCVENDLDRVARRADTSQENLGRVSALLDAFRGDWERFALATIETHEDLVAPLVAAGQALDEARAQWQARRAALERVRADDVERLTGEANAQLTALLAEAETNVRMTEEARDALAQQVQEARGRLEEWAAETARCVTDAEAQRASLEDVRVRLQRSQQDLAERVAAVQALRNRLTSDEAAYAQLERQLQTDRATVSRRLRDLEVRRDALDAEEARIENDLEQARRLQQELDRREAALSRRRTVHAQLETPVAVARRAHDDLANALRGALTQTRARSRDAAAATDALEEDAARLEAELVEAERLEQELARREATLSGRRAVRDLLASPIAAARRAHEGLQSSLREALQETTDNSLGAATAVAAAEELAAEADRLAEELEKTKSAQARLRNLEPAVDKTIRKLDGEITASFERLRQAVGLLQTVRAGESRVERVYRFFSRERPLERLDEALWRDIWGDDA